MAKPEETKNQYSFSKNIREEAQASTDMEIEPEIINPQLNEQIEDNEDCIPDLLGIEEEIIKDKNGYLYIPEKFEKCFIPQNDLATKIKSKTLKFILAKNKFSDRIIKTKGPKEVYVINSSWYNKWKIYSKYSTIKRIIRSYDNYIKRPILFTPNKDNFPGIINNKDLLIRNKTNEKERNILVSKNNDCLDSKLNYKKDFKLLSKERFDLLNDHFKCDYIIKAKRINMNDSKNYKIFTVHIRLIFIPTLALFKSVNEENIENFKKNQNIIYDIYFKQGSTNEEFCFELYNILLENPQILSNMGVQLIHNDKDKIIQQLKNFKFYIPDSNNKKTAKEMADFIFSNKTIELIKKDVKIEEKDLTIKLLEFMIDLNSAFHLNWIHSKNNMDEIKNGIIFVEYIQLEGTEAYLASIFNIKNPENYAISPFRISSLRINQNIEDETINPNINSEDNNNLDNLPLNKEENKHGLVGLNNLGNTCYMNTGLQCLSNCELLTKFFLSDIYKNYINKENPIGSQGEIVDQYSKLIHHIWYGNKGVITPIQFKLVFGKIYNTFNDFRQQDSQEFISYLLDALHEDLNKVLKKQYIKAKDLPLNINEDEQFKIEKDLYFCRNQSFIADLIYGFYKSTVYCPDEKCNNISISFDVFNMISLPLINEAQLRKLEEYQNEQNKKLGIRILNVTFIPFKIKYKPLKFPVKIKKEMNIFEFKKKIEFITRFNKNSFEIYKMQGTEFVPVKPYNFLLEDFLKGEKNVYLFQIPPYVFDKPSNYFDKVYEEFNNDHDKYYLEEEKYEGNDLYIEYNKKAKKNKTDDNLENNENRININKGNEEEKEKDNKIKDDENIEMKDESLNIDRKKWIKAEFYNYSYSNERNKEKKNEEYRINHPKIIYINREWDNTSVYICILEMLEGSRNDLDKIKSLWFSNLKEITKKISKLENKKKFNIINYIEEIPDNPLFLQYLRLFNFNRNNIMKKKEEWKNIIFPFSSERHTIKMIVDKAIEKNEIEEIELLFKIIWNPSFSNEYYEGTMPIEIKKSEKLEEIFKNQKEDEILKKDNFENSKETESKKNKKKLKLEELLNNFKEKEKLSNKNQWYCPKCKQFQLANKKLEIYSVNEIIIIHLKRFRNNRKIDNFVEYPLEGLNIAEYLPNKKENNIYDLFAVANHVGGLFGGHYFAYCKNYLDGEWYEFNDSKVIKIEEKKVVSEKSYVLFYKKRREKKINEEELFKKPLIEIDYSKYI